MRRLFPALLLLSVAACGGSDQTITVKDQDGHDKQVTINTKGETTSFSSGDGKMTVEKGGSTAAFPSYAPAFPGATVTTTINVDNSAANQGAGTMIAMETDASPAQVMAFYKDKLTAAGIKIGAESSTADGAMLSAQGNGAGAGEGTMITARADGGKTVINLIAGHDK